MRVTRLKLVNWRNFREFDLELGARAYVIGANASGKSNLLDAFRFLRTLAKPDGGGLQRAVKERGGMSKVRSLHATKDPEVSVGIELFEARDGADIRWEYDLAFKAEAKGSHRVLVTREVVRKNGEKLLDRPNDEDRRDAERSTQTYLEQINNNAGFREVAEFFSQTIYLHLVPQLLKFGDEISGRILEDDPFGQGLLQRIAKAPQKTRDARLRRIAKALTHAVPHFTELRFEKDSASGAPHIEGKFEHWRAKGAWQREEQFSDGTLRLIGLLWALQEGEGLLLLEEPELSLNDEIVRHIPLMIDRVLTSRKKKTDRQVILSTHSDRLIAGVDGTSVILLEPSPQGTTARRATQEERLEMEHGLNPAEVLLPKTRPPAVHQLGLFE